jgi:DNA-binding response OmpR family regulator
LNEFVENAPFVALVDDDQHSAGLLTRMLLAHGAPHIATYDGAQAAHHRLIPVFANPDATWPGLVIVDLKAHGLANLEFLASVQPLLRQKGVPVVVMVPPASQSQVDALREAGAASVFIRHAELDAYRREAASIISFWARNQRLDAVGM